MVPSPLTLQILTQSRTGTFAGLVAVTAVGLVLVLPRIRKRAAETRVAILKEERERMGRELHDVIAQGLTGVLLQADAALNEADPERVRDSLRVVKRLTRQTLLETKRVLIELRPEPLDGRTLPEALRQMLLTMTDGLPVSANVTTRGTARPLRDAAVESHLFRIAQEAVTNALRHSRARRIDVVVEFTDASLRLVVRDDGCGSGEFRLDQLGAGRDGLRGMQERAESIGARLSVRNHPGGGVEISVEVQV